MRIMATTDLHAYLVPYDYFNDRPVDSFGLTRTAVLIGAARSEVAQSLLFDNGDFLQGSAIGDYLARGRTHLPHSMITAFRQLSFDAGTLGNHEFNFGLAFLTRVLSEATHPIVSANVMHKRGNDPSLDHHLVPPYAILKRTVVDGAGNMHDLKVGVIGFTPPQILQWDRQHLDGKLQVRAMVEAAQFWVPQLRRAGANLVVALAHTGIAEQTGIRGPIENCATDIAAVTGVDVVVAGHSHLMFPGPDHPPGISIDPVRGTLSGKPAVLPGHFGSHLGIIDLVLRRATTGIWTVERSQSHLRAVTALDPRSPTLQSTETVRRLEAGAIDVHRATRRWIRRDIGHSEYRLQSYFALIADSMTLSVMAAAQAQYVATALIGSEHADLPILSAVAPAKAGGRGGPMNYVDIPKGALALRHAADLCPFPNTVSAVRITGAQLADWLERAVSIYHRIAPGSVNRPLINEEFASFQHDRIFGLSYEVDLSVSPRYAAQGALIDRTARRIKKLQMRGQLVQPDDRFILATNSFRSGGAGYYLQDALMRPVLETRLLSRDMLTRHIMMSGGVAPPQPQTWRFAAMGTPTSALFECAPLAVTCLDDPLTPALEPLDITEAGFRRFRLQL